jgi:hypothetical protein
MKATFILTRREVTETGYRYAYSPNLHLGATWRSVINVTPRPLYPRERIPLPIKVKAGWDLYPVCTCTQIRKSTSEIRTPVRPAPSPVAVSITLSDTANSQL